MLLSRLIAPGVILGLVLIVPPQSTDLSTVLMRSTFKLQGNGSMGTAFVLGQPDPANPGRGFYVLITAAHVLEEMEGTAATLFLRTTTGELNYRKFPIQIDIRSEEEPLWVRHPKADVAAMRVGLPGNIDIKLVSTDLLATDETLAQYEIHPGDDLLVLGYPYGAESNEAGFPVLRSGRIASYPLRPTANTKTFLLDFEIFDGNSGGPVYIYTFNRVYGGAMHAGTVTSLVMGLVSKQTQVTERMRSLTEEVTRQHRLGLAVVVHASFIREVIDMLPTPQ